ncbi:MAG TPA: PQQ-binding-like beta-propeller repeat protein [Methylomirabilota bacterium]
MARTIAWTLLGLATALSAACGSTVLQPGPWNQIHADRGNTGFNAVHSALAAPQGKTWSAPVGPIAFSSPAVGPDGTVYIGNITGEAVAINPDGTQRWRHRLGASIVATPAVHMETGEIFYVVQNPVTPTEYLSFLYRLSPAGTILTVTTEQNLNTSAAPKIWREYVFLQTGVRYSSGGQTSVARGYIYVFDRTSLQLVAKAFPGCGHPICGHGPEWFDVFQDILACIAQLALPEYCGHTFVGSSQGPKQDPAVAIVDARNVVDNPDRPTVVSATGFCAAAMRFDPSAAFDQRLRPLWGHKLVGDCHKPVLCTSPAVIVGGQAVFGYGQGQLISFDVQTGTELWKQSLFGTAQSAPVAYLRQIYVVTELRLTVLDSDGTVLQQVPLQGSGRAAALSLKHVHVTTNAGLLTFRLDPQQGSSFDGTIADTGGSFTRSTPTLAPNGTLYVSTPSGFIHAYGPGSP